jgi:putative PIN family toxin of toxin-antitoxin system
MTLCIDTNVVLGMFGRNGRWLRIRQALIDRQLIWAITTEILLEYEEVAAREMGNQAAGQLVRFIELLEQTRGNIRQISPTYRFRIITADPDDNKFADCAITANADFIITED